MTFDARQIFMEVHANLPRQAPGSLASTGRAYQSIPHPVSTVLDIGCGPGMNALQLAEIAPQTNIVGIDLHTPFIDEANQRAADAGVSNRVSFEVGDMTKLKPENPVDVIWSEGAAYLMGVEDALRNWRDLLQPHGIIAYTDAVFLSDNPPQELANWWLSHYPDMKPMKARQALAQDCGYRLLDSFELPETDWWEYYSPMQERLDSLTLKYADNNEALAVLAESQREIDMYRTYSKDYGYGFFIQKLG